jgi:hypothetical protein
MFSIRGWRLITMVVGSLEGLGLLRLAFFSCIGPLLSPWLARAGWGSLSIAMEGPVGKRLCVDA